MMRFRVLFLGGEHGLLRPRRALLRLIAMVIAALPLLAGYAMVLFDDRRRGRHDRLAGKPRHGMTRSRHSHFNG